MHSSILFGRVFEFMANGFSSIFGKFVKFLEALEGEECGKDEENEDDEEDLKDSRENLVDGLYVGVVDCGDDEFRDEISRQQKFTSLLKDLHC